MPNPPAVVTIGDSHSPFSHAPTLERIYDLIAQTKPGIVLQIGDARDNYNWSRFNINPNLLTPAEELRRGTEAFHRMWERVRKASPRSKCIQLAGNHEFRIPKRLAESLPTMGCVVEDSVRKLLEAPGVETHHDASEELILQTAAGPVLFQHGHRSRLGDHARYNQMSTVCGHSHTGGVWFGRNRHGVYWELNAGWCGDELAEPFAYSQQKKLKGWTTGAGWLDSAGPRFISMPRAGLAF